MRVQDVMNKEVVCLSADETFGTAFQTMTARRFRSLPVVDSSGAYLGTFDLYDVWEVLLPRAATMNADSLALPDLAFMPASPEQLREKLAEAGNRSVREFLANRTAPTISPDASVKEAMLLLYRHNGTLPVVDPKSRKLAGVVSAWELLARLA